MTTTVPVAVFYRDQNPSGRSSNWRNVPQKNSIASAGFLFIYGGMGCALGLGFNEFTGIGSQQFQFSWFIGVIAGALVAAPLVRLLWNKIIMGIATSLALASAIIFTSVPFSYTAVLVARYLHGVAIGLAMVAFIVNSSEISKRSTRGSNVCIEQYSMTIGIAVQVIYSTQWRTDFSANRLHGILGIILTMFALVTNFLIIESPVYYLLRSQDGAALDCLSRTVRPQEVSQETKSRLDELKSYVMENQNLGFVGSIVQGFLPLIKMIMYRSCVAFSFALPLSFAMLYASMISMAEPQSWPPVLYGILRVLGGFIAISMMDALGRKIVPLLSLAVVGALTIANAAILNSIPNLIDTYEMSVVCCLSLLSQFFAGLFVPSTSVYLGEAFPLLVKPYFIALTVGIEQVVHIIVIVTFTTISTLITTPNYFFSYGLAVGIIMCVFFLLFCVIIPETRLTTLREAQERFKRLVYLRLT